MKKMTYEYLIIATNDLYQRLDKTAIALCSLKDTISRMADVLKTDYEAKYKQPVSKYLEN